jgi:hypothetical protein
MEKSILEWLQEIPTEKVRKQAIENYHNAPEEWKTKYHYRTCSKLEHALDLAFEWRSSPQGDDHWYNVSIGKYPAKSIQQERDEAVEFIKSIHEFVDKPEFSKESNEFKIWQMCNTFLSNLNK